MYVEELSGNNKEVRPADKEAFTTFLATQADNQGVGVQARLAAATGVTGPAVSRWITGLSIPKRELWPAIEEFFNLEPGTLSLIAGINAPAEIDTLRHRLEKLEERLDEIIAIIQQSPAP